MIVLSGLHIVRWVSSCLLYDHMKHYYGLAKYQVFSSRERLASIRNNFDLLPEMPEEGVHPEIGLKVQILSNSSLMRSIDRL